MTGILTLAEVSATLERRIGPGTHGFDLIHLWADDVRSLLELAAIGMGCTYSPNGALHIRRAANADGYSHLAGPFAVRKAHETKGGALYELRDGGVWCVGEYEYHSLPSLYSCMVWDVPLGVWLPIASSYSEAKWHLKHLVPDYKDRRSFDITEVKLR